MVAEKLPAVVVLEETGTDDVRLVEGFSDKLLKLMDELPEDWEVCLLGAIGNVNPDVEPFHMKSLGLRLSSSFHVSDIEIAHGF
eukprot:Skav229502  [mRNA]  locus=scaffold2455:194074:196944:- [translate_table: standard]